MAWSFIVTLIMFITRVKAVRTRAVRYSFFRTMQPTEGQELPKTATQVSKNYSNLFEMTTVFYAYIAISIGLNTVYNGTAVALCWAYVALRVIHSIIHITSNNITHRLLAFALSMIALMVLWVQLAANYSYQ